MSNRKSRREEKNKGERERLRLKKEKEQQLELEAREELESVETQEIEEVEKEYGMPMETYMEPRPTSFEELDALEDAREKAEQIHETTWQVQDLVRNILHDMELSPTEQADRIQDVADEFAVRVNAIAEESGEEIEKDMDVLQIEAILAADRRHTSLLEKGKDMVELVKAELSAKTRKRLQDGDFALPGVRKYPIHDKAHVRNALARAAQQIKGGGKGAEDAKAALPKIRAAAKKMGIEMGMEKSALMIEKDGAGDWRWIGKPSNNFIDWQGDIMSKAAHQRYVEWFDANADTHPLFLKWHTPGTHRQNPIDFAMEHEGALIMSGKLTEKEAAEILKMQALTDIGMSVAGTALRLNKEDPRVITHYWLFEVSDLPLEKAANPFTSLETISKEAGMDKLKYLSEMMGSEEKAKAFLEKTGQAQKELQDAGLTSKEAAVEPTAAEPVAEVQAVEATPAPVDVEKLTKQIADAVGKEFDIEGLNAFVAKAQESLEKVALLEGMVKDLQGTREDELVELLTPPVAKFAWSAANRPSASEKTKITKETDEKLEKAGPGVPAGYWLSEVTGTVPVEQ